MINYKLINSIEYYNVDDNDLKQLMGKLIPMQEFSYGIFSVIKFQGKFLVSGTFFWNTTHEKFSALTDSIHELANILEFYCYLFYPKCSHKRGFHEICKIPSFRDWESKRNNKDVLTYVQKRFIEDKNQNVRVIINKSVFRICKWKKKTHLKIKR